MRTLLILAPSLLLVACGSTEGEGTLISINGDNVATEPGNSSKIAIKVPGFRTDIDLPKIQLDASNFDINGASLPAGSKVKSLNVAGDDGIDGKMRVVFTSPIGPVAVRDWFKGKLAAEGFKVTADGNDLTGTAEDGEPFSLTTKAIGPGASQSVLTMGR